MYIGIYNKKLHTQNDCTTLMNQRIVIYEHNTYRKHFFNCKITIAIYIHQESIAIHCQSHRKILKQNIFRNQRNALRQQSYYCKILISFGRIFSFLRYIQDCRKFSYSNKLLIFLPRLKSINKCKHTSLGFTETKRMQETHQFLHNAHTILLKLDNYLHGRRF